MNYIFKKKANDLNETKESWIQSKYKCYCFGAHQQGMERNAKGWEKIVAVFVSAARLATRMNDRAQVSNIKQPR